jgi:hypothetical protein
MRKLLATLVFAGLGAAAALAVPIIPNNAPLTNTVDAIAVGDDYTGGATRAVTRYDNWNNPPSLLNGLFRAGADEIADDCTTAGMAAPELLTNMGINVANIDAPSNLTGGQVAVRLYRLDTGAFINGFNANLPVLATPANSSNRLQFADGALDSFGIMVPDTGVYVSLQWNTATFAAAGAISNLGYQQRGPIAVGSSTDNLYNITAGGTAFNFGGNPLANTGVYVRTVPEPASLGLLVLGALACLRRR